MSRELFASAMSVFTTESTLGAAQGMVAGLDARRWCTKGSQETSQDTAYCQRLQTRVVRSYLLGDLVHRLSPSGVVSSSREQTSATVICKGPSTDLRSTS